MVHETARRARRELRRLARRTGLHRLVLPRRTDVCCCGLSKTGTHSMAGLFADFRGGHHPDSDYMLDLAMDFLGESKSEDEIVPLLHRRDRRLWLEIESSNLCGILIRPLLRACPDKRFVITIRDVFGWFNSWMDHNLNSPPQPSSKFHQLDRIRLRGSDFPHTPHDRPLKDRRMDSLEAHFAMWARHYGEVLAAIPEDRRLIVKTADILSRTEDIASFSGVPPALLRLDLGWQNAASVKHDVLSEFDREFVRDVAERHCRTLMDRHFANVSY